MSDIGISFDGRDPVDVVLAKTAVAVRHDRGAIWLACHLFQREPIVTASVLLSRFPEAEVVLVALSPYVVHPVYIAMAAATLNEFFPGRVSLCLGVGAPADLASAGIETEAPVGTMRDAVEICRALFRGERVRVENERFQVRDRALAAGRLEIPILLAASGPRMLRLAGREADGVVLSAGASAEFVGWCLEQVGVPSTAERFRCHAFVHTAVADEADEALERVRPLLANLLRGGHHLRNLELAGSDLDQAALSRAIDSGDTSLAESFISNRIVDRHAAAGSPETFRARMAAYRAAGVDNIVLASMRTPEEVDRVLSASRQ